MSDSFRNVKVSQLRAAVVASGFNPEHNQLDKIIQSNANFHRESADRVKLNMSKSVCDRLQELVGVSVETLPPSKPTEPTVVDPVVPATTAPAQPDAVEPQTAPVVEPPAADDAEDAEDDAAE